MADDNASHPEDPQACRGKLAERFEAQLQDCWDYLYGETLGKGDEERLQALAEGFSFKKGKTPRYEDPLMVAYYQLKYGCLYAFDYYCAYTLALKWLQLAAGLSNPRISSFGCGSGLDCWAAHYAACDPSIGAIPDWHGYDLSEWGHPEGDGHRLVPPGEGYRIHVSSDGLLAYFENGAERESDVYFFPRIVSELQKNGGVLLDEACDAIVRRAKSFKKDRFVVCISMRKPDDPSEREACGRILDAFASAGHEPATDLPAEARELLPERVRNNPRFHEVQGGKYKTYRIKHESKEDGFPLTELVPEGSVFLQDGEINVRKLGEECSRFHAGGGTCGIKSKRCTAKGCTLRGSSMNNTKYIGWYIVLFQRGES